MLYREIIAVNYLVKLRVFVFSIAHLISHLHTQPDSCLIRSPKPDKIQIRLQIHSKV